MLPIYFPLLNFSISLISAAFRLIQHTHLTLPFVSNSLKEKSLRVFRQNSEFVSLECVRKRWHQSLTMSNAWVLLNESDEIVVTFGVPRACASSLKWPPMGARACVYGVKILGHNLWRQMWARKQISMIIIVSRHGRGPHTILVSAYTLPSLFICPGWSSSSGSRSIFLFQYRRTFNKTGLFVDIFEVRSSNVQVKWNAQSIVRNHSSQHRHPANVCPKNRNEINFNFLFKPFHNFCGILIGAHHIALLFCFRCFAIVITQCKRNFSWARKIFSVKKRYPHQLQHVCVWLGLHPHMKHRNIRYWKTCSTHLLQNNTYLYQPTMSKRHRVLATFCSDTQCATCKKNCSAINCFE